LQNFFSLNLIKKTATPQKTVWLFLRMKKKILLLTRLYQQQYQLWWTETSNIRTKFNTVVSRLGGQFKTEIKQDIFNFDPDAYTDLYT